ncbi:MAG: HAD-IC family P-type ATPase [Candidatus Magasanikbacteria bacterium]|nr:HAD-IC family P-type ATPase [Candidatus Magasanikbacteria bacterium]
MVYPSFTTIPIAEVLAQWHTTPAGLSAAERATRLIRHGRNEIAGRAVTPWQILGRQFRSPFIALLIIATALSFLLGEWIDGVMIVSFVVINAVLGFLQEYHSEQSLKLLKRYTVSEARVRAGGSAARVDSATLVPGDIVVAEAGDIIPADVRWIEATALAVNESVLTGEAVSVDKISDALPQPPAEHSAARNIGFSGTTVVAGKGVGVVIATGSATVFGSIAELTAAAHPESSFAKGIRQFSRFILRMIVVILLILFIANLLIKGPQADLFGLILFSIALAVSVVPEALPVVTTIAFSKGALRLAKNHVVVKRLSAVEDLGSIEVLCTDKTGTLTENSLTVAEGWGDPRTLALAAAASPEGESRRREVNNAFDLAIAGRLTAAERQAAGGMERLAEIPFDPERRCNSVLVQEGGAGRLIVRGALEAVIQCLTKESAARGKAALVWSAAEGRLGRRVIAIAERLYSAPADALAAYTIKEECGLTLVGCLSFVDPLKKSARVSLEQARHLGVAVKILTGDSREVAGAVGVAVGLIETPEQVVTGAELSARPDRESRLALAERTTVFARVSPEQKYQIIELLKERREVGFLGEGINDAPALKIAHVGLAVQEAADIAREAADVVLLRKSLAVIVDGIRQGREVFANTTKYIKATLISNFGNFYAVAVASLLSSFLPMRPVQLLLLNLLSDFPMIAIATDTVDKGELRRPRSYQVREIVLVALLLGLVSTVFDFIFFGLYWRRGPATLQTNWFIGSVLTELVLIFSIRTRGLWFRARRPGALLSWLSGAAFLIAVALPLSPWGQRVFHFAMPRPAHLITILGIVVAYFAVTEAVKLLYYRHTNYVQLTGPKR